MPTGTFTSITAGANHACGLATDSTIECWGANSWGKASPPTGRFRSVEAGANHTCGLRASGDLICWGRNQAGQTSVPPWFG
ncbi:hypothetical protein [Nocardioides antri]|uniref:hypothetical protein n=1 Tax=Nocardioides antri TaxID=2607659 RepID=UPI0034CE272C